ncbi:outer membrane protein [Aminobacter aganoensis]|uniref:Outer membrane immunogenic protein n=1 Tax=Aminobacter aganoensis TaxID=83264 RepID=A0A7X0KJN5_9HYPH|nr:outer membrane protein [Aminobacter aganoensis]MBB6353308.1 outer membrane immunogenic protein [Aminobacter aganoensis]
MSKRNLFPVLFAALAAFATPVVANAADVASDYYQESSSGAYDWSGVYGGAHVGVSNDGFPNPFSSKTGWQLGGQVGANFQSGMFVYGAEADASFSNGARHNIANGAQLERKFDAAAKVRAGVGMDRTLVYGTAGYGVSKFDARSNVTSGSNWEGGLLLGAGVEQAISDKVTAKVEYNRVDYGKVRSTVGGTQQADELDSNTLKAGLNYRF